MASWKSKRGIWTPAKEKAYVPADPKKGRPEGYVYEGPDRQAQALLDERKVDHIGMDALQDPEVIMRARQLNMTVPEFMKLHDAPEPAAQDAEQAKTIATHSEPSPKAGVQPQGGASPDTDDRGGFGEVPKS